MSTVLPTAPARTPGSLRTPAGLQLLGPLQGSGFRDPRFLVMRPDGQVVHLSRLLYLVVEAAHVGHSTDDSTVAQAVSAADGREVSAEGVRFLVETKLGPLGLVSLADSGSPDGGPAALDPVRTRRADPLLGLRLHVVLLRPRATRAIARLLAPVFATPVVVAAVAALVAVDAWLLLNADLGSAIAQTVTTPGLILVVMASVVLGGLLHECGHAAACHYGGARPGAIGMGVYVIWPAFYTDVTDAYRLGRAGRLRTDLAGVYVALSLATAAGAGYAATGWGPLLLIAGALHLQSAQQLLPVVRLDGYYALGDLVGVPDLFGRVRPILAGLLPGRPVDPRVAELLPRTRRVVTAWVLVVVPLLAVSVVLLVRQLPALLTATAASVDVQLAALRSAASSGDAGGIAVAAFSLLLLAIPLLGLAALSRALLERAWRGGRALVRRRGAAGLSTRTTSRTRTQEAPVTAGPTAGRARDAQVPSPLQEADTTGGATVFTEDRMLRRRAKPPERGWRRAAYVATGGHVNVGPSRAELAEMALIERVRTRTRGTRRVVVLSRKGGVGKTTTSVMLGHTFAAYRGDRIVAVDANPDAGNLAYRVRRESAETVTSLLLDRSHIERYTDVRAYTSQAPTRLEVLASDDDPRISQALGEIDYHHAIDVLDRHYTLVLLDTGTGILDGAIQGILEEADQIVVVMPPALDGARVAASTLDWLEQHGFDRLVGGAVAVVNGVRGEGLVDLDRVADHFARRCSAVVRIPWDRTLEAGAQTALDDLSESTRHAYLELAAAVADQFVLPSPRRRQGPGMSV